MCEKFTLHLSVEGKVEGKVAENCHPLSVPWKVSEEISRDKFTLQFMSTVFSHGPLDVSSQEGSAEWRVTQNR